MLSMHSVSSEIPRGQTTHDRIVAEAAAVFNRRGYAGTALSDLMEATGLKKGGIYRHFSSKEELAAAAFEYSWKVVSSLRLEGIEKIASPLGRIRRLIANYARRVPSPLPGGCPLMNTAVDADDTNPQLLELARKALHQLQGRLAEAFAEARRLGEVRRSVDPNRAAGFVISSLQGALLLSRIEGHRAPLHNAEKELQAWLRTLLPPPPVRRSGTKSAGSTRPSRQRA